MFEFEPKYFDTFFELAFEKEKKGFQKCEVSFEEKKNCTADLFWTYLSF